MNKQDGWDYYPYTGSVCDYFNWVNGRLESDCSVYLHDEFSYLREKEKFVFNRTHVSLVWFMIYD